MSELDDLVQGVRLDESKDDRFEVSTLKLLLGWLGMPRREVLRLAQEHGEAFTWEWFNAEGWIDPQVGSGKDFRFGFEEFFTKPKKHPVVQACLDFQEANVPPGDPWIFIFNVYGVGRLAATNLPLEGATFVQVAHPRGVIRLTPAREAFAPYLGLLGEPN